MRHGGPEPRRITLHLPSFAAMADVPGCSVNVFINYRTPTTRLGRQTQGEAHKKAEARLTRACPTVLHRFRHAIRAKRAGNAWKETHRPPNSHPLIRCEDASSRFP